MEKKILKIKKTKYNAEYLLRVISGERMGVETTKSQMNALNIKDWDLSQLSIICKGLRDAGYTTEIVFVGSREVEEGDIDDEE